MIQELIEKIEAPDPIYALEWLGKGGHYALSEDTLTSVIRFLLKDVNDLRKIVNNIEYQNEQQKYLDMGDDL